MLAIRESGASSRFRSDPVNYDFHRFPCFRTTECVWDLEKRGRDFSSDVRGISVS